MRPRPLFARLAAAALPLGAMLLAGVFAFRAVAGDTGLIAWGGYKAERRALEGEAERVAVARAALAHRVNLLDPAHVDPDYADELVREQLGFLRADEVVVPLSSSGD